MDLKRICDFNYAAKIIESDGVEGIHTAIRFAGEDVAFALLIAHLRIQCGSKTSFPPPDDVYDQVKKILEDHHLLDK